jgi:hypothetical protein
MTLKARHLGWLLAWSGAAYGLVLIGLLPSYPGESFLEHALCGPWG